MSISDLYDATFDSVGFLELYPDGFGQPGPSVDLEYTIYHYPGSDSSLLVTGGKTARKMELTIAANKATMDTLNGKVGQQRTLVYSQGSFSALLVGFRDRRRDFNNVADKAVMVFVLATYLDD